METITAQDFSAEERKHIDHQDILGLTPLHYAMMYAHPFVVEDLAASGARMSTTDIRGRTPLHYLCRTRLSDFPDLPEKVVGSMLRWGAMIEAQDVDGVTPLHIAALHNLDRQARPLLEAGANFNLPDKTGYSPLLWAARGGAIQVAELLLERLGEEGLAEKLKRAGDHHGRTILHVAAMADQASFIEWLVSSCGLPTLMEAKDNLDNTPIHLAAQAGKENAVNKLLHLGSDTMVQNQSGCTPMHLAARKGLTEIVRILFHADNAEGSRLQRNWNGHTPLHLAVLNERKETVELLLSLEPDCRRTGDFQGEKAIHCAAMCGLNDMIDLLFEDQDTQKYDNQRTPLHLASQRGHIDTVKLLVAKGVSVTSVDRHDQTPIDRAIEWGHEEVVQFLLSQPGVRLEDKSGNTLLHLAAPRGLLNISRLILEIKKEEIDVNSTNADGNTPLHLAAKNGQTDMVDFLIEVCKCDKTPRNNAGYEPIDIAEKKGHQNVVNLMVSKFSIERNVGKELGEEVEEYVPWPWEILAPPRKGRT